MMAFRPDPHALLTVYAVISCGMPDRKLICRAGLGPLPAPRAWPMITSFTAVPSTPALMSASLTARTPRSAALRDTSAPPNLPIAVRTADAINTDRISVYYNERPMKTEDLKILLALEPKWTLSLNGLEFLAMSSSDITLDDSTIRFGPYVRKIQNL